MSCHLLKGYSCLTAKNSWSSFRPDCKLVRLVFQVIVLWTHMAACIYKLMAACLQPTQFIHTHTHAQSAKNVNTLFPKYIFELNLQPSSIYFYKISGLLLLHKYSESSLNSLHEGWPNHCPGAKKCSPRHFQVPFEIFWKSNLLKSIEHFATIDWNCLWYV